MLAIDGGGLKGVFPASFLATIEETIGQPIADYFDLTVGTSTGGIIALGLGLGLSAAEILDFYVERGPQIFAGNRRLRGVRQWTRAKYDPGPLEQVARRLRRSAAGESKTRLVIPSFELETGAVVWRSKPKQRIKSLSVTSSQRFIGVRAAGRTARAYPSELGADGGELQPKLQPWA